MGWKTDRRVARKVATELLKDGRVLEATIALTAVMMLADALIELAPAPTPKVGDILYSSWGYDQTNVDYYQVVGVAGASVRIRKIAQAVVESTRGSERVAPQRDRFVDTNENGVLHRVMRSDDGYVVRVESRQHAWLWDGKPRSQTASGWGH